MATRGLSAPCLPLLPDPMPDAAPVVEGWLARRWNADARNSAALYLAEPHQGINERAVDGLLARVTSHDDRTRLRICLVLQGGITVVKRNRYLSASNVGAGQAAPDYDRTRGHAAERPAR
jgi:hypothetical protein